MQSNVTQKEYIQDNKALNARLDSIEKLINSLLKKYLSIVSELSSAVTIGSASKINTTIEGIPTIGDVYFNTQLNKVLIYDGKTWVDLLGNPKESQYVGTIE